MSPTREPLPSTILLVASVVDSDTSLARGKKASSRPFNDASIPIFRSCLDVGALDLERTRPLSKSTTALSVNVPPVSIPMPSFSRSVCAGFWGVVFATAQPLVDPGRSGIDRPSENDRQSANSRSKPGWQDSST